MRIFLFILLTLFVFSSYSQSDSITVLVKILDKKFGDPIQNVNSLVHFNEDKIYAISNSKGEFRVKVPNNVMSSFQLSHPQFISIKHEKRISGKTGLDTLFFEFKMEFIRSQEIEDMVVSAPGIPKVIYQSKRLHVEDFEILKDGNFLLLTYSKRLKKGSELLLFDGKTVLNTFQVPDNAEQLVRDYRGNAHVVCEENVFGIHVQGKNIGISSVPKDYFLTYISPILDTNKTKLYFSNFNPDFPAFEYFTFDQLDSSYKKIMHIEDDLMMELYRAEYKWADVRTKLWAKNKEIQTGVDAEVWVGANYFTQSIYYKELYAPLFHRNDSVFVFDYYKDKLFTYNESGDLMDSTSIYHHYNPRKTGWKKQLIQDKVTGQLYALYDRGGYSYLGWINVLTGEITEQVRLEYRYIEKVEIHNNFVYYVYRPFESPQKKYLYHERLPYDFGIGSIYSEN